MITTQIDDLVGAADRREDAGFPVRAVRPGGGGRVRGAASAAALADSGRLRCGGVSGGAGCSAGAVAFRDRAFFADNRGYCIGIEQICHALQDALGDHIVRLPLGWFTKDARGRLRLCSPRSCRWPWTCPAHFLRQMVIAVTTPAAVVVLFLFVDWRIGLVFVIAAPLLLWASRAMAKAAGEGHRQEELSNAEVAARVLEFAHAQPVCARRSVRWTDGTLCSRPSSGTVRRRLPPCARHRHPWRATRC